MKTNPLEKMKKRSPRTRFFWCYTLGFLLCAAGCYCWFLIKGKTLIVDSDAGASTLLPLCTWANTAVRWPAPC